MANTHFPAEDPILEWSAPQHHHPERGTIWYICAAAFVLLSMVYSVKTGAWTFSILIVVLTTLYWKLHGAEPPKKRMRIYKRGFALEDVFTEWKDCNGYWIFKGEGYFELNIELKTERCIKIQTGEDSPYPTHDALSQLLPELPDRRERVLDTIIRICKL